VRNIVQHRRAVRSLRDSEELTRAILTSALDAVVSIDERGIVREFNPAAEQLFGYSKDEAVGKFMAELLIPAAARDAHRAGFQRYLKEGSSTIIGKRLEMQALKRDGSLLPVEIRVSEVRRGQARIFTAYLSDISERLEALSTIGEERDKLEAILSATSDGIILVDPSGFVRYANKSFEEFFDIDAQSVERMHVRELVERLQQLSPLPVDSFEKLLASDGPPGVRERRSERCSVSLPIERSLQVSRKPVGSELAEQGSWLVVFHDISRDEEIRRAKDDLVGNVSHELRTPLTAIRGFVQLMLDKRVGDLSDQQRKFLDVISENIERLMQLVSDLLDVDRVERVPLRAEDVDASVLIDEAIGAESARAKAKDIELVVDVADDLHLVGDRERLLQVLQNLIGNAVKYTREGTVRATARPNEAGMAVLEVSDTGIGMSDGEQEVAFDRFFRSNDEYVREAGGTGLGLSIVRTLVERHGGSIEIDSVLGEGTTFRILLPFDADAVTVAGIVPDCSEAELALPTAAVELGYAPLILLVEDSAPIRDVLREGLELEGLRVTAAATGEKALAMAAEQVPDAVLLDISLPDMDGWEVLTTLRSDPRLTGTAILVLSGLDEPSKALRMGADRFICKPVDVITLSDEIGLAIEVRSAHMTTTTGTIAEMAEL
jgi:PAS domain S-box-containing protein